MTRIKKIYEPNMADSINISTLHSIVTTKDEEIMVLFDCKDIYVYDMRTTEYYERN